MLDKCRKARRERLGQLGFTRILKCAREQQGPSIIIYTVAMGAVRDRIDCVLEHSCTVAEREEMADPHLRKGRCLRAGNNRTRRNDILRSAAPARSFKDREIAL